MKKYPFVKQEGIKDCGPACLLMIIKYYKGFIPLEQLRDISKTTKMGTDAFHLIEAAKEVGFEAKGIKTSLNSEIILPAIAHVKLEQSYGHYVVIYRLNLKKNSIIIGDPAVGIRKIKIDEFLDVWDNILIELFPIRNIPITTNVSFFTFLIRYITPHKKEIISLLLSSILITLFSCLSSFYFRWMVDNLNSSKRFLFNIFILFVVIYVVKMVIEYLKNRVFIHFKQKLDMNMSCDIFDKIVDLPYRYYRNRTTGEIMSRFNDLENVREMIYRIIISLFSDFPFILVSLILLFCIEDSLALLLIVILSLYVFSTLILIPVFRKYISRIQEQNSRINSFMTEVVNGFETVKNCSLKVKCKDKFSQKYYKFLSLNEKFFGLINVRSTISELVYQIGLLFVIYMGIMRVFDGSLTIGNLIMFYSVFTYFIEPLKNVIELSVNINEATSSLKRMLSIFVEYKEKGIVKYLKSEKIEFNNLNYYYNDVDHILKNISLTIKKGEKVLIIGKSGSGKSTLLKLLMKYYETSGNQIYINNIDINHYTSSAIEESIGYVSQQETLFTDSIENNLNADNNDDLLEISKICEIDQIMKIRNLNYHSIIEENGFNLSGGERQRIILGRLLLKKYDILMIDEGLNQMDVNLERRVLKRIFDKYKSRTIIVVSHRLDNMDLYNHVVEISKGRVVKDVIKNA